MMKQAQIEERILGLILGVGIGTILGFFLRAHERRGDAGNQIRGTILKNGDDRQLDPRLSLI